MSYEINDRQKMIYEFIKSSIRTKGLTLDNIRDVKYVLLNTIARFSLAKDRYLTTEISKAHLVEGNYTDGDIMARAKKKMINGFKFEHPVPSKVIFDLIWPVRYDDEAILDILCKTDVVTILTTAENKLLNKLVQNMPANWSFKTDSMFARYIDAGLEVPTESIQTIGAINR